MALAVIPSGVLLRSVIEVVAVRIGFGFVDRDQFLSEWLRSVRARRRSASLGDCGQGRE